jgi:UDP-N-acetylmuramoylalanine--D-glutamate ligase
MNKKYSGKNILILGFARSGQAACRLLLNNNALVTVYDSKELSKLSDIPEDLKNNINFIDGNPPEAVNPKEYDTVVTSPGISPGHPIIKEALAEGISVISELQLGLEYLPDVKIIAVTGTNGKTTTCKLLEYFTGGRVAGNIGFPLSGMIEEIREGDVVVLEVSSYQIPFSPSLKPDVGVVLNVFPEHLDWHGSFKDYVYAKKQLFLRQAPDQVSICNANIEDFDKFTEGIASKQVLFSLKKIDACGVYFDDNNILYRDASGREEVVVSKEDIRFPGKHNLENIMAAIAAWKSIGGGKLPPLSGFDLPPHRIQEIGIFDGVKYINDSKATNMDSTIRALESF